MQQPTGGFNFGQQTNTAIVNPLNSAPNTGFNFGTATNQPASGALFTTPASSASSLFVSPNPSGGLFAATTPTVSKTGGFSLGQSGTTPTANLFGQVTSPQQPASNPSILTGLFNQPTSSATTSPGGLFTQNQTISSVPNATFSLGQPATTGLSLGQQPPSAATGGFNFAPPTATSASTFSLSLGGAAQPAVSSGGFGFGQIAASSSTGGLNFGQVGTTSNTNPALNFSQAATTSAPGLNFGIATTPSAPVLNLGQSTTTSTPGLNFGQTATTSAAGLNFGQTTATSTPALNFGQPATTSAPGLNFGLTTATSTPGLNFGLTATTSAPGLNFALSAPSSTGTPTVNFGQPAVASTSTAASTSLLANALKTGSTATGLFSGATSTSAAPFGGATSTSSGLFSQTTSSAPSGGLFNLSNTASSTASGFSLAGTTSTIGLGGSLPTSSTTTTLAAGLGGFQPPTTNAGNGNSVTKPDGKCAKEVPLPNDIFATIVIFETYKDNEKKASEENVRQTATPFHKLGDDAKKLRQHIVKISNQHSQLHASANKLKTLVIQEAENVEMARRTQETPIGLQGDNKSPELFFLRLVKSFEDRMTFCKNKIDEVERCSRTNGSANEVTSGDMKTILMKEHEMIKVLASRVYTLHNQLLTHCNKINSTAYPKPDPLFKPSVQETHQSSISNKNSLVLRPCIGDKESGLINFQNGQERAKAVSLGAHPPTVALGQTTVPNLFGNSSSIQNSSTSMFGTPSHNTPFGVSNFGSGTMNANNSSLGTFGNTAMNLNQTNNNSPSLFNNPSKKPSFGFNFGSPSTGSPSAFGAAKPFGK